MREKPEAKTQKEQRKNRDGRRIFSLIVGAAFADKFRQKENLRKPEI
jgi:hypothetical protein